MSLQSQERAYANNVGTVVSPARDQLVRRLSLAVPAYNEAAGIERVVRNWLTFLRSRDGLEQFEIVVCNDGSNDETGSILRMLSTEHPEVKLVDLTRNQGAAAALATAITNTIHPWVLLTDSDGQFPIENLDNMMSALQSTNALAATGVRVTKNDSPFARFGSWASGRLCNMFHGTRYRDFNCAFKLISGDLLRSLHLEAKGLNYSTEITSKLIEREVVMAEVEIKHLPRQSGTSSLRLVKGALHRIAFVVYIGLRQLLLRSKVIQVRQSCN